MSNIDKRALTDEAISKAFAGTNFGRDDFKNILAETVIDAAAGWRCGYTATTICTELGLLTPKGRASALGLRFISEHVQRETKRLKDELEAAAMRCDEMTTYRDNAVKKIVGLRSELTSAEKRIAELEARDKPKFVQCWSCKHDIEVLAIADCDGYCPRCAAPIDLDDEPYAAAGKGEQS